MISTWSWGYCVQMMMTSRSSTRCVVCFVGRDVKMIKEDSRSRCGTRFYCKTTSTWSSCDDRREMASTHTNGEGWERKVRRSRIGRHWIRRTYMTTSSCGPHGTITLSVQRYKKCKGNVSCTSYSRTFYDTQMATANCVHPHAQLEHA